MPILERNALTQQLVQNLTLVKVKCSMSVQSGITTVVFFNMFEMTVQTEM